MEDDVHLGPDLQLQELITKHFAPGVPGEDCDRRTTEEIHKVLDDHAPGYWHTADVFEVLKSQHYSTQLVGEVLYWLVRMR